MQRSQYVATPVYCFVQYSSDEPLLEVVPSTIGLGATSAGVSAGFSAAVVVVSAAVVFSSGVAVVLRVWVLVEDVVDDDEDELSAGLETVRVPETARETAFDVVEKGRAVVEAEVDG